MICGLRIRTLTFRLRGNESCEILIRLTLYTTFSTYTRQLLLLIDFWISDLYSFLGMRVFLFSLFLFSLVFAEYANDKYVYDLTPSTFDKVVQRTNYTTIVKFYAPWCGYCKQLKPIFLKLGKFIQSDGKYAVNVAAVNCDIESNKQLCAQYQVSGYPTIMVFRPPKYDDKSKLKREGKNKPRHAVETYNGERTLKAMWQFLQTRIKNYVVKFPSVELSSFSNWLEDKSLPFKRAILLTESKQISPMFKSLAIDFFSSYRFATIPMKGSIVAPGAVKLSDGSVVSLPEGLNVPSIITFDEETKSFNALDLGSIKKSKKTDNVKISEWLVKQNNGKLPSEGPLSKKEQKYYSKYRTGKASYVEVHDEL